MSITHGETQIGRAGSGSTSVTSASISNVSSRVYLAFISTRSNVDVTSVSGMGLTWTPRVEQCGARAQQRIEMWSAVGDGGSSGAVTAGFASCNGSTIMVVGYDGVDAAIFDATSAGYNTIGLSGACTGGTDNDDALMSLVTSTNNALVVAGWSTRNRTMTNTGSWTNRVDDLPVGTGGDLTTTSLEDIVKATAGNQTAGSPNNLSGTADWCGIICALKEAAAATGQPTMMRFLNVPGARPWAPRGLRG